MRTVQHTLESSHPDDPLTARLSADLESTAPLLYEAEVLGPADGRRIEDQVGGSFGEGLRYSGRRRGGRAILYLSLRHLFHLLSQKFGLSYCC